MSAIVTPGPVELDLMNAMVALADYTGAKLHLYNNDLTPDRNNVLADFLTPVYSGYAPIVVTWSPAFFDVDGNAVSSGGLSLFTQAGSTGDNIYGCFLTDSAGTKLLWSSRIDGAPFSFVNDGDTLPLAVMMSLLSGIITVVPGP